MSQYQYMSLDNESIRILELLPGEFDDPLKGCIKHRIFISSCHRGDRPGRWVPIYEALSYAWGEQDDPEILSIFDDSTEDERLLQIGKNLASALRDLRHVSASRILWCDAVCIDQRNLPERATQVQRMADIFRHADRVVVWLAPDKHHLSHAMRKLDEIASHVGLGDNLRLYTREGMEEAYLRKDYLLPFAIYDWQCVVELLSLSWFTRLWVRQEISLANYSAIVMSGKRQLLWSEFSSAFMYLDMKLKWEETVVKAAQRPPTTAVFRNVWNLIDCRSHTRSWVIIKLLEGCQCADPRDRIFGIRGLQRDIDIQIDYTKSVKEVYADWTLAFYREHSSLSFLEECEVASSPSWVPNLDKPKSLRLHRVNSKSDGKTEAAFQILSDGLWEMLGTRCGIIKQQTSTMSQKLDLEIIQRTVESWVRQFFPRGTQYHEGLAVSDLAETITGGRAIEYYEHGRFSILDAEAALLQGNEESTPFKNSPSPIDPILLTEFNHLLPGAAVFATNVGHFGLGSGAARVGDEIFVVFGCSFPIVMRHVEDSKYTIVGPCYVPKLSHGEAVLGPLPDGWRMIFNGEAYEAFIAPDGRQTFEDPRLDTELPPEWSQDDHEGRRLCWKKLGDSKCRKTDPRQTPEQLEARGIKLENIKVV